MTIPTEKICSKCKTTKSINEFYVKWRNKVPKTKSDWLTKCKTCSRKYGIEKYEKINLDPIRKQQLLEYRRGLYNKNKESILKKQKEARYGSIEKYRAIEAERNFKKSKNKERLAAYRAVRTMDPQKRYIYDRWKHWQHSAKSRRLEWNIDFQSLWEMWEKSDKRCFYTGRELMLGSNSKDLLSLDRKDSDYGYSLDNVVFCTHKINLMKLDNSTDEFVQYCKEVYEHSIKAEK